ncbi:hypothetical protein MKS88_005199 [Plasmodium brasilianum]|uniref:Uncharacterized protein n=1 Tax=Plasmodium brasilianum TaxID=5824 RepID=A0ACB9Y4Y9_PLABR|nr:hypothetical protein MKS88_005199 [Plasmodium brasilianum]
MFKLKVYKSKHNLLHPNERNLAEGSRLRLPTKRSFDCSFTVDESIRIYHILYVELLILGDIITYIINHINRTQSIIYSEEMLTEKVRQRVSIEMPSYPQLRIDNMTKRLKQQVEEVFLNKPLNQDKILKVYEGLRLEFDTTMQVLDCILRESHEDIRNHMLNNLPVIRLLHNSKLTDSNILISDDALSLIALRIRARILDLLQWHFEIYSLANNS